MPTSSIADVLGSRKFEEPPEIMIIKDYVNAHFKEDPGVSLGEQTIIIKVSNASLAGALRMHLNNLQTKLKTKKRLIIRIGR